MTRQNERRTREICPSRFPIWFYVCLGVLVGLVLFGTFAGLFQKVVETAIDGIFGGNEKEHPLDLTRPIQPVYTEEVPGRGSEIPHWFSQKNREYHSAILIAGSRDYGNYRHQADVCHAFQILKNGGLALDQIITFVFDDIAHNSNNPYPGQIFNKPGGGNVYPGCAKDYISWDVNKATVLAVLMGNEKAVRNIGSGRVLKKNPYQKVFLFYSDHGSPGSISMPYGPPIYADELNHALGYLAQNKHFAQMLIYLESCEAGSMFRGFKMDSNVVALTAANAIESSYATYCPEMGIYHTREVVPNATYIKACLGDLFSVSWMEHTEKADRSETFLEEQAEYTKFRTSNRGMYVYGSHVVQYGDYKDTIMTQIIGNFLSYFNAPTGWTKSDARSFYGEEAVNSDQKVISMDQRQADLVYLYQQAYHNADKDAAARLEEELVKRDRADRIIREVIQHLIDDEHLPVDASVEAYATEEIFEGGQLVDDWDCLRQFVEGYEAYCDPLDNYSRKYTLALANLCNSQVSMDSFAQALIRYCNPNQ